MSSSDGELVLRTLADANVQFVVIGEPDAGGVLQLVVSRHPTNLEALGRALDTLGSSLRPVNEPAAEGVQRIGDPAGTLALRTNAGDVDLVFGGQRRSLYADTLERAEERDIGGTRVRWSEAVAPIEPGGRVTSRVLGRRLLTIAEGLTHLMERRGDSPAPPEGDGEQAPTVVTDAPRVGTDPSTVGTDPSTVGTDAPRADTDREPDPT